MGTTQGLEQRPVGSLERKKSAGMKMSFSGAWPEFGNVSIYIPLFMMPVATRITKCLEGPPRIIHYEYRLPNCMILNYSMFYTTLYIFHILDWCIITRLYLRVCF